MAKGPDFTKILASINKGLKTPIARRLSQGGLRSDVTHYISTGIDVVDRYVLGGKGLPCGRMVELFSGEGVGKTSLAIHLIAQAQRAGVIPILAETEIGLESERLKTFNVNWDEVILIEPGHTRAVAQQAAHVIERLPANTKSMFVWDSVAATMSKEEAEDGIGKGFDKRAKDISQMMRVVGPLAAKRNTALVCVNQTRAAIGVMFGPDTVTPGGNAMKFHASIRLCMYQGTSIKSKTGRHTGKLCTIQAVKTRFSEPWRKAKLKLDYTTGWDNDWSTLYHAKEVKLVPPRTVMSKATLAAIRERLEATAWIGGTPIGDIEEGDDDGDFDNDEFGGT